MHLVITDSGLGGLSVCAGVENALRRADGHADVRITYVNAWPEEDRGYNDLPDVPARAAVFDRALEAMRRLGADRILIACNTLSILYPLTRFSASAGVPVQGIVEAGIDSFAAALAADPASTIVLLGTRTTIESGVHHAGLLERGVPQGRIASVSCHGLATAIENGPFSAATDTVIDTCAERAARAVSGAGRLHAGFCCTHYGMVGDRLARALERTAGRPVSTLDPNQRLVRDVVSALVQPSGRRGGVTVEMISKVELTRAKREGVAALVGPVSPATAEALRSCARVPALF